MGIYAAAPGCAREKMCRDDNILDDYFAFLFTPLPSNSLDDGLSGLGDVGAVGVILIELRVGGFGFGQLFHAINQNLSLSSPT